MAVSDTAKLVASLELQDKFSKTAKKFDDTITGFERKFGRIGTGLGQVGTGLDKIITRGALAAAGGLTAVITTAASFEQAWAGVTKTVEGANDALRDDFKDLSRQIPLSFEELASIGAAGGALGIATKDLLDFTDIVARLAVSTDLTSEAASTALGQLANVLHLSAPEMRDLSDSLVALGNDGASTESQIIDLTTRFAAAGKQAGLSNEAILALASTTASMGVEAEAGGGALSRIFNGITIDIATATEESEVLAESMGLSLAELRTAWDRDAGKVFGDLLGHINELDKFQAAEFLSNLGITNTRDINAITLLASGVEEYNRQLGVSVGQTNELDKESDAFFNTTQGKWQTFQNNVRLAADSIGSRLLPVVNDVMGELVDRLSDPAVQKGLTEFGTNLADGIRDFIKEVKNADFGPLLDTLKGAAGIARTAFDAFNALPSEVKQLALAALVANKVTGGAIGDITKGLTNIFLGTNGLFARGASPANPVYVAPVGGGLGGGPTTGPTKGGGKFPFIPVATGVGVALSLTGSQNPDIDAQQREITDLWERGILTDEQYQTMFHLAYQGIDVHLPTEVVDPFDPSKPVSGRLDRRRRRGGSFEAPMLPDTAVQGGGGVAVLPDTAIAPVTDAVDRVNVSVRALPPILLPEERATARQTARVAERVAEARNATQRGFTATADRLSTSNARLAGIERKNFSPTVRVNVTSNVTISEIQRRITSQQIAVGRGPLEF